MIITKSEYTSYSPRTHQPKLVSELDIEIKVINRMWPENKSMQGCLASHHYIASYHGSCGTKQILHSICKKFVANELGDQLKRRDIT